MARKRKPKKAGTHRRRRSSRVGKIDFMQPLFLIGGAIAGNYLKQLAGSMLTFGGKNYAGPAVLGVGVVGRMKIANPNGKAFFDGMSVSGGVSTLHIFVPAVPINGLDMIGLLAPPTIAGYLPREVNGVDQIGNGFRQRMPYEDSVSQHDF